LAIKEMGRQIAEAEGIKDLANDEEEEAEEDAVSTGRLIFTKLISRSMHRQHCPRIFSRF